MPDYLTQFNETLDLQVLSSNFVLKEEDRGKTFLITGSVTVSIRPGLKVGLQNRFIILSGGALQFSTGTGVILISADVETLYNIPGTVIGLFGYQGQIYLRGKVLGDPRESHARKFTETTFDLDDTFSTLHGFPVVGKQGETYVLKGKVFIDFVDVSPSAKFRFTGSNISGEYNYRVVNNADGSEIVSLTNTAIGSQVSLNVVPGQESITLEFDGYVVFSNDGTIEAQGAQLIPLGNEVIFSGVSGFTMIKDRI